MIQRKTAQLGLAVLGVAVGVSFLTTGEASAAGCNGVVSQLEWGCAAWDNNNGPQFPHYKKSGSAPHAAPAAPVAAAAKPVVGPNGGSGIVAQGGGNVAQRNASGIVAAGAGNLVQKNGSGIVAAGAGNAVHK